MITVIQRLQMENGIKIKRTKEFFFSAKLKHCWQQNKFGTKLVRENMSRSIIYTATLN